MSWGSLQTVKDNAQLSVMAISLAFHLEITHMTIQQNSQNCPRRIQKMGYFLENPCNPTAEWDGDLTSAFEHFQFHLHPQHSTVRRPEPSGKRKLYISLFSKKKKKIVDRTWLTGGSEGSWTSPLFWMHQIQLLLFKDTQKRSTRVELILTEQLLSRRQWACLHGNQVRLAGPW